jgi:Sec-independent protein secretion pathway component TatC
VTAGFLWRHLGHGILIIFIVAALLTTSTDAWTQTMFALPMIGLYLISIVIAWIVGPKREKESANMASSRLGGLVIAATAFEQARRRRISRSAGL